MSVSAPPPTETVSTDYRPLSGMAVIGLLFGLASPLVFFVNQAWVLFAIVLPGFILSLVARRRVMLAPDTLAGYIPATFGVVLTVACGLGWMTHKLTANWILEREARAFLEQWFGKLRAGEDGISFLDSVEPQKRLINFDPEPLALKVHFPPPTGGQVPLYDMYRNMSFVSIALRYGEEVQLTALGRPEERPYLDGQRLLRFPYRCVTPVGQGIAVFNVMTGEVDSPSGKRREWHIGNVEFQPERDPTPYGIAVGEALSSAESALARLGIVISRGDIEGVEKLFAEGTSRRDFDRSYRMLRGNAPQGVPVQLGVRLPLLLVREERLGDRGWKMLLRGQFEDQAREVEFEAELYTSDLLDPQGWIASNFQLLGERRRIQADPVKMETPGMPADMEGFRTR